MANIEEVVPAEFRKNARVIAAADRHGALGSHLARSLAA